jgi:DNA topoisomerase-1
MSRNNCKNKNKILLIVESPAKCSTIVSHLGADKYVCVATFGHLRELAGLKDIDTTFKAVPGFHVMDSKTAQIEKIRALVAECKETYLMTDNDREGAGIAYHVCCMFGLPIATTKRIMFNEITKPALERAIQSPQLLNMDAVHAQIARQTLDMLVGFKVTPTLWSHVQGAALSAGRCQTPALRLIYDNQCAINAAAEGTIVYNTVGYFTKLNLKYDLNKGHDAAEACSAFMHASAAFEHVIRAPDLRPFSKTAPLPLTTCALQQQASNELNLSPADTMLACQHLYEGGYITYPRTDSRAYSEPFLEHARAYITEKWGEKYNYDQSQPQSQTPSRDDDDGANPGAKSEKKKRIVIKKKKTAVNPIAVDDTADAMVKPQEAHEAVHVTSLHCSAVPETLTAKEQRLYRMIWRHSAESCMAPCTGKTLTSCITAPEGREYRHSVERTEFAGWRIVSAQLQSQSQSQSQPKPDDSAAHWSFFQAIVPDSAIKYNKLQSRMHVRELKSHYSEASLVGMLEERGIGRPSTFSSLVHKIQERGYVARQDVAGRRVNCVNYELDGGILSQTVEEREFGNEKNRLVIQPLGCAVLEFLCAHFAELFDYDYTKRMEQQLDQVSSGEKRWSDVCSECLSCVDRLLNQLSSKGLTKCAIPLGDGVHEFIMGKYGPLIRHAHDKVVQPVRKDVAVDYARLKRGEYRVEDLVLVSANHGDNHGANATKNLCKLLGTYNGADLFLRTGKYGPYLTWGGDQKQSLPHLKGKGTNNEMNENVDAVTLTYDEAVRCIESSTHKKNENNPSNPSNPSNTSNPSNPSNHPSILREISAHASVRDGQYGPYIYYKNPKMKTPAFVSLRGFKEDWKTCDAQLLDAWSTTTPVKKK